MSWPGDKTPSTSLGVPSRHLLHTYQGSDSPWALYSWAHQGPAWGRGEQEKGLDAVSGRRRWLVIWVQWGSQSPGVCPEALEVTGHTVLVLA